MKRVRKVALFVFILSLMAVVAACGSEQTAPDSNQGEGESAGKEKQKQYVLKYNHVLSESHPFHQAFLNWAESVEERTDGGLKIEVYHSAQLGVEEDIIEQLKEGANVGQNTDSGRIAQYVPEIAVMNGPYFVDSIEEVEKLRESPTVQSWLEEVENEHGIKVLSFNWVQGLRHMVTNEPIRSPEDLDGLRIRTPGAPIWQESVRAIGATPVALPFGEVYVGMQQGAVDGAELVYRNITGGNLYEVADYMSETGHIMLINFQVVGKKFFDSLPAEYQDILVEEANRAGAQVSQLMEKEVEQIKAQIQKEGMQIVPADEIDMEAFKKAGEAAYEKLNLTEAKDKVFADLGK